MIQHLARTPIHRRFAVLVGALTIAVAGQAAEGGIAAQERARCLDGRAQQERDACLREVGAAQQERQRGTLADGQAGHYMDNALQRCNALPTADQADCRSRVRGEGARSGSVGGGGVLKETVTRTVGQPAPAAPAASAASSPASDPAPVR